MQPFQIFFMVRLSAKRFKTQKREAARRLSLLGFDLS